MRDTQLDDLFGRAIVPGDSFLRIEDSNSGANLRYYFLGAIIENGDKIQVQEYGGVPRTILRPHSHKNSLLLLTPDLMSAAKLTPPTIEEVTAPKAKAIGRLKKGEHVVI